MSDPAKSSPSAQQLACFNAGRAGRPVVLVYQCGLAPGRDAEVFFGRLAELARSVGGELTWAAAEEEVLIGALRRCGWVCTIHFPVHKDAVRLLQDRDHSDLLAELQDLEISAVAGQPRRIARLSRLLAAVLPHVPFNNAREAGEEPGIGSSSIMPSLDVANALYGHPDQDSTVVMVNWLKFRAQADYGMAASARGKPISGQTAYYRYGKVAMLTTHSLGAKLLFVGRYQQVLVGNGGDPGRERWDEFALMQYPGRSTFTLMSSLKRYRRALIHRTAGLAEQGQGLMVSRPLPEFIWPQRRT